jgi:hypothetical protein
MYAQMLVGRTQGAERTPVRRVLSVSYDSRSRANTPWTHEYRIRPPTCIVLHAMDAVIRHSTLCFTLAVWGSRDRVPLAPPFNGRSCEWLRKETPTRTRSPISRCMRPSVDPTPCRGIAALA